MPYKNSLRIWQYVIKCKRCLLQFYADYTMYREADAFGIRFLCCDKKQEKEVYYYEGIDVRK